MKKVLPVFMLMLCATAYATGGDKNAQKQNAEAVRETVPVKKKLIISPNPAHDKITVELEGFADKKPATLFVYDMYGKEMIRQNMAANSNKTNMQVDVLSKGVYLLFVLSGDENASEKFTKQ